MNPAVPFPSLCSNRRTLFEFWKTAFKIYMKNSVLIFSSLIRTNIWTVRIFITSGCSQGYYLGLLLFLFSNTRTEPACDIMSDDSFLQQDDSSPYVMLERDNKPICRTRCFNLPFKPPILWKIWDFKPKSWFSTLELPRCQLYPEPQKPTERREWGIFADWIRKKDKVGIVRSKSHEFYILPPHQRQEVPCVDVCYQIKNACYFEEVQTSGEIQVEPKSSIHTSPRAKNTEDSKHIENSHARNYTKKEVDSLKCDYIGDSNSQSQPAEHSEDCQKIHLNTNPSYLKTLGQAHAWIFGAIAELVDNSRDARATRLDICIESLYLKQAGKQVPVLSVVDDGHGMSHNDMVRMLSLGHNQPDEDDPDHIGRFGVGFKTGAMKLGKDVVVLTQTSTSRSVALFSQSFNENKENMEVPIVTYCRHGNYMEIDSTIQSNTCTSNYMNDIKDFSPFNEYFIGEKFRLFGDLGTGTQIYIWNLDEWGSDYTLEWNSAKTPESASHESNGDILIRSRRLRSRPGQISQKVPLDYSLKAYLEVIFLDPRMKIYVQGSLVKSRPLAKSLSRTVTAKGHVMGKPIQLTLGRSHEEWQRVNCGIFLYWHGRLIEAYKRVGGMVHNADMGRGVIGVVDVTNIMIDDKGHVWVMNTKQGFQDCEAYARLEEWLGSRADEYWDNNFDTLELRKGSKKDKPDHDWVQCDKCRKWRMLSTGFNTESLPEEWFCYMYPYNGKCETPEQQVEPGVVTVSAKRSRGNPDQVMILCDETEVPLCSISSPSGSNDQTGTQSKCKRQHDAANQRSRNTAVNDKGRQNVNSSLTNCKNAGKGESRDNPQKADNESPPQPNLKRLRRGLPRNYNQS